MKALVHDALGYAAVSACSLAVDAALLALLVGRAHWPVEAANTASFLTGACVAYALSVRFVFDQHRLRNRRAEFLGFIALGSIGVAVNVAVLHVATTRAGLHLPLAKAIAAVCSFSCNFIARRQLLFVQPRRT